MRDIWGIVVHTTATLPGQDVTVEDINQWHLDRGFRGIGYHRVVYLDGSDHAGRPEEEIGAHVSGYNTGTLGVAYVGGLDANRQAKDTRAPEQREGLLRVLKRWLKAYPDIQWIKGHNDLSNKFCPCFDASAEYQHLVGATIPDLPPTADTVTTKGQMVNAYRYPSIGTPIADIPAGSSLPANRTMDITWTEVTLPNGEKGWLRESDIV